MQLAAVFVDKFGVPDTWRFCIVTELPSQAASAFALEMEQAVVL